MPILTPTMELPFAGHPTLGAAFVLAARRQRTTMNLETGRGLVGVRLQAAFALTGSDTPANNGTVHRSALHVIHHPYRAGNRRQRAEFTGAT